MLTQAAGYAAMALGYISGSGGAPVLVKDVAAACEIPGPYLAKIIHTLSRAGLVVTQRGVGGGVVLAKPAADITLYDICLALSDPIVQQKCMLGTAECSDARACPAHSFWVVHRAKQVEFLRGTKISDIATFETRRRGALER